MKQRVEQSRLTGHHAGKINWKHWGPCLSERAWGTAFDVVNGQHLWNQRLFAVIVPGFPDGNVHNSSWDGVQVFNPSGDLIGEIQVPNAVNFTFGGHDNNVLFITNDTTIWAATLQATGATRPTS